MPFSYRVEARRQEGSKFPKLDMFKDVYVRPDDETTEQLHAAMVEKVIVVLQEAASQHPLETLIENVTVPEDAGFQILTEILDQKLGHRHGKVVWGMGKVQVCETGASFFRPIT
ncbi:hypothetical protein ACFX1W_030522 [Malus domestica]